MTFAKLLVVPAILLSAGSASAVTYVFEAFSSFGRGPNDTTTYSGGFEVTLASPITVDTVLPLASLTSCTVFASFGNPVCIDQEILFGFFADSVTISHSFSNPDDNDAGGNFYYFDIAAMTTNGVYETILFGADQAGRLTVTGARDPSGPVVPEPATWAMLIAGFGLVGATMRRRRAAVA